MGILDVPAVPKESLGTKLRRLADRAQYNNAWTRPYMKACPPWQPSTAYVKGNVVAHGGYLFVCVTAGTTAATGGPTVVTDGNSHADGTAAWTWFGYNQVTTDPQTTQNAWAATTAYTLGTQVINSGNVYAVIVAGTSAGSGGPTTTTAAVVDNTVTWTYLGPSRANPHTHEYPTYSYATAGPGGLTNVFNVAAQPEKALNALPVAGGSGYVAGDTITLSGGTGTAAVLTVTTVTGGAVTAATVSTAGAYTVLPVFPTTQASTSGAGTGATFNIRFSQPPGGRFRGCYPLGQYASLWANAATFQATPNAASVMQYGAYEFWSDAPKLYLRFPNASAPNFCVIIDGVRFNLNALDPAGAAGNYYLFDFTATSGKKKRLWRVEVNGTDKFPVIGVDVNSQVWAPDDANKITAACISDSLFAGSGFGPFVAGNSVSQRVGQDLGWTDVWAFTQGGTGYVNRGTAAGVTTDKYAARITEALITKPDIWVLMGSTNDIGQASVAAAVTSAIQAIRTGGSTSPIVVFGLWSLNNAGLAATETAVQTGVTGADTLAKTWFVPIYNDPTLPWITGSWNNNPAPSGITQTTSTNSGIYIAGDATHPPDLGTEYLAKRIANAIRGNVLPNVA